MSFTKPTLAQQFPATVNRELGHNHNTDVLGGDAGFAKQLQHRTKRLAC